jgi:hypothetical protein
MKQPMTCGRTAAQKSRQINGKKRKIRMWKLAGALISNWNQIVEFLKQIAMLQVAIT